MICKNCGATTEDDLLFCTECGSKSEPARMQSPVCSACGAVAEDGIAFCTECGAPLSPSAAPTDLPDANGGSAVAAATAPPQTETVHCTECGAVLACDAAVCPQCGTTRHVPEDAHGIAHCTECGAVLRPNAKFCNDCGAPVSTPSAPPRPAVFLPKKRGKLLIAVAAALCVGVLVVAAVGPVGAALNPHSRVVKSYDRTVDEWNKECDQLVKNLDFLAVADSLRDKPATRTLKFSVQRGASNLFSNDIASILSTVTPQLKIESDRKGKLLYADVSAAGYGAQFCAQNDQIGVSIPALTGNRVFAANTKTLGADLITSPIFLDSYYAEDLPESFRNLSFSLFDDPQKWSEAATVAMGGASGDVTLVQDGLSAALDSLSDSFKVEKIGSATMSFGGGKTAKVAQYDVVIPAAAQHKFLRQLADVGLRTASFKQMVAQDLLPASFSADLSAYLDHLKLTDQTVSVSLDASGRLLAVSGSVLFPISGYPVALTFDFRFSDPKALLNGAQLRVSCPTPDGIVQITLDSSGNHIGKDGCFTTETMLTITAGEMKLFNLRLSANYQPSQKGNLSMNLVANSMGYPICSANIAGTIDASKKDKTMTVAFSDLSVSGVSYHGETPQPLLGLSGSYTLAPGVSAKGKSFFKENGNVSMILKMTPSELYEQLQNSSNTPAMPAPAKPY